MVDSGGEADCEYSKESDKDGVYNRKAEPSAAIHGGLVIIQSRQIRMWKMVCRLRSTHIGSQVWVEMRRRYVDSGHVGVTHTERAHVVFAVVLLFDGRSAHVRMTVYLCGYR